MSTKKQESYRYADRLAKPFHRLPDWYRENHRILPWRDTGDPYDVWVSEIMLQQTRVGAVKEYFLRFRRELPDVQHLAEVPEERLLKLWEGLGYYSRPRNMKRAARIIMEEYGGRIPDDPDVLRSLPGIGSYTAGAISSIAYGIPEPAVDGNVLRVCARIAGNDSDIALAATKKQLETAIRGIMKTAGIDPGDLNQSLMELGALICVPNGSPSCAECPVSDLCEAHLQGKTDVLPVKAPKKKRRIEKKTVLLIENSGKYLIHRRRDEGLLAGLWEFPSAEGFLNAEEALRAAESLLAEGENTSESGAAPLYIERMQDAKHIFSHVEWRMHAYRIRLADPSRSLQDVFAGETMRFADAEELRSRYPLPAAFAAYRDPIREAEE
jgi:A/G-specific adenine glycosylase